MAEKYVSSVNEKNLILSRAKAAIMSRDFITAQRLYKQLIENDPSNVDYLNSLASAFVKNSEDEKAIPIYEKIIEIYPHYIEAMNSLGAIYRRLHRYDESITILQKALKENRQLASVNYNLGFTYKELKQYDKAIESFENVIIENPSDVLAYNHLGFIYLAQRKYEKSIATFKKGLQIDQNHPILNYNLATCYKEDKQVNEAIRCYERALRAKPGWVDVIKDFSSLLIDCQKTKEASDLVQKSIELHPNDTKLLTMLGQIYLDQYDYDSAEKIFKRAQLVDGKDIKVLTGLAKALEKGEKPQEALDAVIKALELDPDNNEVKKQYVHTLLSAEEYEVAHDNVQNLYEESGNKDPQVLDLYGQYCICTDDDDNAQNYYDEIEKNNKHYKEHLLSAAGRYNQIGNNDKAEIKAKEYVSKNSRNPSGYNMLGKIYAENGEIQKAIDSYNKSKSLRKPNILAEKQIEKLQVKLDVPLEENTKTEEVLQDEVVLTQTEEEDITPIEEEKEEFDFGTMGDNVPMGEALLEKEDDFFEDDEFEQEEPEEEIKEEEPEEDPYKSFVPKENPYKDIEDDSISPFGDLENSEEKSDLEKLVPGAEVSEEEEDNEPDFMKNPFEPRTSEDDSSNDYEQKMEKPNSENNFDKPEINSSTTEEDEEDDDLSFPSLIDDIDGDDNFDFDQFDDSFAQVPEENLVSDIPRQSNSGNYPGYESGMQEQNSMPQTMPQNSIPQNSIPQNQQPQMQPDFSGFQNEMQKKMQDAMMDSAKYAMDTAMNAQKMAQQLSQDQENLKQQIKDTISDQNALKEAEEAATKAAQKAQAAAREAEQAATQEAEQAAAQEAEQAAAREAEQATAREAEQAAAQEAEQAAAQENFPRVADFDNILDSSETYDLPETFEDINPSVMEDRLLSDSDIPKDELFIDEQPLNKNWTDDELPQELSDLDALSFEDTDLSETASSLEEMENQNNNDNVILDDSNQVLQSSDSLENQENPLTAQSFLPKIQKMLEDENLADQNSSKIDLFKKLLTFREFLSEKEKEEFDSGKIRMLLEYIIQKMSGKPGLLKTAQSLIKAGLLGEDFDIPQTEEEAEGISNELIKKVLIIMKNLAMNLEDKGLCSSLIRCADIVLEKIELEDSKSQIF